MAAAAVLTIVVSCRPETTAGQEEPPVPGPPPVEESIAPSITPALDSIILYPYGTGLPSCVEFSIEDLSEGGEVSVQEQEDLDLSLTYERTTGCGALTILATEAFLEKSKAILVARNGELSDEKEIIVKRAYINVSPQSFSFGPSGGDQRMTVDLERPGSAAPRRHVGAFEETGGAVKINRAHIFKVGRRRHYQRAVHIVTVSLAGYHSQVAFQ